MIATIILAALYLVIMGCALISIVRQKWAWAITFVLLMIAASIVLGGSLGGEHG